MVTLTVLDSDKAPPRATGGAPGRRQHEYNGYLTAVPANKVGMLTPAEGETPRAVMARLKSAARRLNCTVDPWSVDGKVYFKVKA